jgi:hypothetical protein
MGIRFSCPNGHKLHVKEFLAGKRAVCPHCGAKLTVPAAEPSAVASKEAAPVDLPASDIGSHSAVIATLESPAAPPVESLEFPPLADFPAPLEEAPVLSDAALPPPDATPLVGVNSKRRRSPQRMQIVVAMLLMAMLIVVVFVLIWVLMHRPADGGTATDDPSASAPQSQPAKLASGCDLNHALREGRPT